MQDRISELMAQVEREYQMGGLSDGIYGDFARDVAQLMARECANICKSRNMGDGSREDQEAVRCHDAICARFGLGE